MEYGREEAEGLFMRVFRHAGGVLSERHQARPGRGAEGAAERVERCHRYVLAELLLTSRVLLV